MTNMLMTILISLTTNWTDTGSSRTLMWPEEANITTHYERGTVTSNVIGVYDWAGESKSVVLYSMPIGEMTRSYQERMVRDYSAPTKMVPIIWLELDGIATNYSVTTNITVPNGWTNIMRFYTNSDGTLGIATSDEEEKLP